MTALAGCWNFGGNPHPGESCERMLAAQAIYGPHDGRQWSDGSMAIGRRLFRTLPEDMLDRQPLHGGEGRFSLVADVRLDNRDELASALGLGPDRSRELCDAELLLLCLERWGEAAVDRLVGDFAFALWNAHEQTLLLARDFLGQRPLHYHRGDGFFAFASMPKGLHALPEVPYAPDEHMAAEFITLLPQLGSRSFFAGIETVEAGQVLKLKCGGMNAHSYWNPARPAPRSRPRDDYVDGLRHHLDQAVQARLRGAGGAVGTHLSGGFDSAAVTATAARLTVGTGGKVVAFTSVPREGYDGPSPPRRIADEGALAAQTAALYDNVEHVLVRGEGGSPLADLDRYFVLFDRPLLNLCNMVWVSAINELARRRKLSVLLTGQMGNMSISYAGTERLAELLRAGRLFEWLGVGRQLAAKGTMRWTGVLSHSIGPFLPPALWQRISEIKQGRWDILHYTAISPRRLRELDLPWIAKERRLDFTYRRHNDGFNIRCWILRRTDPGNFNKGMLAGWGIDQRDPTADRRLVEYCLAVPMEEYLGEGRLRSLAGRALGDRVPAAVLNEYFKGYQAVDWHESLSAARAELHGEIERLVECEPAARALNVTRLRALIGEWPETGWNRQQVIDAYRLALLRGVSAGHFLRKASGSNL